MVMIRIGRNEKRLLKAASKAVDNAHVLWGLRVGAAVLGEDGEFYEGCNVESWISGLGICAERCAVDHAVLHGNKRIKEVAIVMDSTEQCAPRPCGACLQYIYDFASSHKVKILMAKTERGKNVFDTVEVKTLKELLPFPYKKREFSCKV
jgi:cytidine deaminase